MDGKCPYCGAQHYDEVERDLAKLARMQPVVDAACKLDVRINPHDLSRILVSAAKYKKGEQ